MKTYVLMLSRVFPATHPRKGYPTGFREAFRKTKWHTIRANYNLWSKRFEEIAAGNAVLSIRQWSYKPYQSKQIEIARLTREDGIGIQCLDIANLFGCDRYIVDCYDVPLSLLAENDGLSTEDFLDWFKGYDKSKNLAIIHFTKFRY